MSSSPHWIESSYLYFRQCFLFLSQLFLMILCFSSFCLLDIKNFSYCFLSLSIGTVYLYGRKKKEILILKALFIRHIKRCLFQSPLGPSRLFSLDWVKGHSSWWHCAPHLKGFHAANHRTVSVAMYKTITHC